ncbi:transcriptional regulator [Gluconobacter oxydans]|nr:transcriptional regulator [Gluconobacter oxydans]GAN91408.1 hypothetical protein Gbfr_037_003 [Gluconobacter frateurii M-2]
MAWIGLAAALSEKKGGIVYHNIRKSTTARRTDMGGNVVVMVCRLNECALAH